MKLVYETCRPRQEVLSGELVDSMFAAALTPVVNGVGPTVYSDPVTFFANTYPTQGLKDLIREVFSRLSGHGGNPVVRLETPFGGGKTHGMIALYHLATNPQAVDSEFLADELRPQDPVRVAVLVGRDLGPEGTEHDGVHVNTLWGELAWQLGGREGYQAVAELDRQMLAPGTETLLKLVGSGPVLIMFDEIGHYIRRVKGKKLAGVGTLADQVPAFIQALAGAVAQNRRAVLVLTLTGSEDPYPEENEQVRQALVETGKVTARQEVVIRPTRDEEVAHVVVRRLFEDVDRKAAADTAAEYHSYLVDQEDKGALIPPRAARPEYRSEIERTYPFHPELLRILMTKTATIPEFQRTRGALRLLARIVRRVWREKPESAWLIHPAHVDLCDEGIRADLTERLGEEREGFGPVVEADICNAHGSAHAQEVDKDFVARDKSPLGSWVARTVFLHSLTHGQAGKAETPEIVLACARPGLDPELVVDALTTLEAGEPGKRCWFLHSDEQAFWFSKEAGLARVIDEQRDQITTAQAKEEVRKWIRQIFRPRHLQAVYGPERPVDVDDTHDKIKLCVMDFDFIAVTGTGDVPAELQRIYEHAGTSEGFRQYKNTLLFLVADKSEVDNMLSTARTYMALQRAVNNADIMAQLNMTNQKRAREDLQRRSLDMRVAITRAYRHLFYPESTGLRLYSLNVDEAVNVESSGKKKPGECPQEQVVIKALTEAGKLLQADGPAPSPDLVLDFAWPHGQSTMTTAELVRAFRSRPQLPMLLSIHRLRETVERGVEEDKWVYYDGNRIFARDSREQLDANAVRLDDDHELWTLMEASERGYCFKCGHSPCQCPGKKSAAGGGGGETQVTTQETLVGPFGPTERLSPQRAFQEMLDWAKDNKVGQIKSLTIELSNCQRLGDLQQVWTGLMYLIPIDSRPELLQIDLEASFEHTALHQRGENAQVLTDTSTVTYNGTATTFRRIYDFVQAFGANADGKTFTAVFKAQLVRPLPPDAGEIDDLRRRLVDNGVEQISLSAEPADLQRSED